MGFDHKTKLYIRPARGLSAKTATAITIRTNKTTTNEATTTRSSFQQWHKYVLSETSRSIH